MKFCRALFYLIAVIAISDWTHAAQAQSVPDAIYHNGKIVTVDGSFSIQQAFAVKAERFVAVGTNAQVRALAGKDTRVVDLGGATVIPGLTDNHDHLWNAAKYMYRGVDLIGVTSFAEAQTRIHAAVAKAKAGEVVFTTLGWTIQPAPTRQQLDAISTETPIIMIGSRRGVGIFNTAALNRLGVSKANPIFMGSKVPVDESGEPRGTAAPYPAGLYMVDALLPALTLQQQDEMVQRETQQRHAMGITSVRELALWPEAVAGLRRIHNEGKLKLRMAVGIEFPDQAFTAGHLSQMPPVNHDDPWLFIDSVGEEPWTPATMPVADYSKLMREMNRMGWRPTPHVGTDVLRGITGEDAINQTLIAYEAANRESALKGKRWYVEHVPMSTPEQIQHMARLGLVISVQDFGYRAVPALPKEKLDHYNPIRSFLDNGLTVIGGSDYNGPTAAELRPNNPLIPFSFFVTRKTHAGDLQAPAEKITREEALRIFTANSAYATFQEKLKGQIAPGMLADFVILNQDLLSVPDDKILATQPLATFIGGTKVYSAPGSRF